MSSITYAQAVVIQERQTILNEKNKHNSRYQQIKPISGELILKDTE